MKKKTLIIASVLLLLCSGVSGGTYLIRKVAIEEAQAPVWSYGEFKMSTTSPTWSYGESYVHDD